MFLDRCMAVPGADAEGHRSFVHGSVDLLRRHRVRAILILRRIVSGLWARGGSVRQDDDVRGEQLMNAGGNEFMSRPT